MMNALVQHFLNKGMLLVDAVRFVRRKKRNLPITDDDIQIAQDLYQTRLNIPKMIRYPSQLPISHRKDEILQAWTEHQIIILESETGSGKSTQLPKIALEAGFAEHGLIGITQPRRLAVRSIAARLSQEMLLQPGQVLGWQIRHQKHTHPHHLMKLMTDGILLQEMLDDKFFNRYQALIIDEVHERSVNIDLLLGYLKNILPKRPDLKIALVSATLNTKELVEFFPQAHVIKVPGKTFEITDHYLPNILNNKWESLISILPEALSHPGHLLFFLPTEQEIFWYAARLKKIHPHLEVLPLYAKLSFQKQQQLFEYTEKKRIILSTNIAETSLTLPDIGVVIDSGDQKIATYDPLRKVTHYPVIPTSLDHLTQRRGRVGRVMPGHCYRLFTQEDEASRQERLPPQIARSSLLDVLLKITAMGISPVQNFPFLTAPDPAAIKEALQTLHILGLLTKDENLTPLGKKLSIHSIDPRFSLMLYQAKELRCEFEMAVIVAFLLGDEPRLRPYEEKDKADKKQLLFLDQRSDYMSVLQLWMEVKTQQEQLSNKGFQAFCQEHFLQFNHLRAWKDNLKWIQEAFDIYETEVTPQHLETKFHILHRCLLAGLIDRIFYRDELGVYCGPKGVKAKLHPSCSSFRDQPTWVVALYTQKTHETYLRLVGPIEVHVAAQLGKDFIKYQQSDPFYDDQLQDVYCFQKGTLFGLPLLPASRQCISKNDPVKAREVFIQAVCTDETRLMEMLPSWGKVLQKAQVLCCRARCLGAVKSEPELVELAMELWPKEIVNGASLSQYKQLIPPISLDQCLRYDLGVQQDDFPDHFKVQGELLECGYVCDASNQEDGLTYVISQRLWLSHHPYAWVTLHPYYRKEILRHLLLGLSKSDRQNLQPIDETLAFLLAEYEWPTLLTPWLQQQLALYYDVFVSPNALSIDMLPPYLRPRLIIDDGRHWHEKGRISEELIEEHPQVQEVCVDWLSQVYIASRSGLFCAPFPLEGKELSHITDYFQWRAWGTRALCHELTQDLPMSLKKSQKKLFFKNIPISQSVLLAIGQVVVGQDWLYPSLTIAKQYYQLKIQNRWPDVKAILTIFEKVDQRIVKPVCKNGFGEYHVFAMAKEVLEHEEFYWQLDRSCWDRLPLWWSVLEQIYDKQHQKQKLCTEFLAEWKGFLKQSGIDKELSLAHPAWILFFEWAISLFLQPMRPIFPISQKKAVELSQKTDRLKRSIF